MKKHFLFQSFKLNHLELKNRIVMAPLTRRRAADSNVPCDMMTDYYSQRAAAGLIIAEATQISRMAAGYPDTPGIYNYKQIEGWKKITDAVHAKGGLIFLQLWHVGRYSHPYLLPDGRYPVAPSAIAVSGKINTPKGYQDAVIPVELSKEGIKEIIRDFQIASKNAIEAGFDGVEIHGANGYLINQFLCDGSNKRTDEYGGSVENRSRFLFEILDAVCFAIGKEKVGLRLSPSGIKLDMYDSDPVPLFSYVINRLNDYKLAYLHLIEPILPVDHLPQYLQNVTPFFRKIYMGVLIANWNLTLESAQKLLDEKQADLVSFGKLFISNPDLVHRFENNLPLSEWDTATFYEGGTKGYTDYPVWNKN